MADNLLFFGTIAIKKAFLTQEQLDEFFKFKRTEPQFPYDLLQDYLLKRSCISKSDHMQILNLEEKANKMVVRFIQEAGILSALVEEIERILEKFK